MKFVTSDDNTAAIKELFSSNYKLKCAVAFWGADAERLITAKHQSIQISDDNTAAIKELFSSNYKLKCAVAFWGADAERLITAKHQSIQIICNLESGATNPYLIEKLRKKPNIKIKTNKELHAKVYLAGDKSSYKRAIVGSANASANGLSYEEELNGWIEAGIVVEDEKTLSDINEWFKKQWDNAVDITDKLIKKAEIKWKKKRNSRFFNRQQNADNSILTHLKENHQQFKDRKIFIAIHRCNESKEAAHYPQF